MFVILTQCFVAQFVHIPGTSALIFNHSICHSPQYALLLVLRSIIYLVHLYVDVSEITSMIALSGIVLIFNVFKRKTSMVKNEFSSVNIVLILTT